MPPIGRIEQGVQPRTIDPKSGASSMLGRHISGMVTNRMHGTNRASKGLDSHMPTDPVQGKAEPVRGATARYQPPRHGWAPG